MSTTLNYLIEGYDLSFPIDINNVETIGQLKKVIKKELKPYYEEDLKLWKVNIPFDELNNVNIDNDNIKDLGMELHVNEKVTNCFPREPVKDHVHLFVRIILTFKSCTQKKELDIGDIVMYKTKKYEQIGEIIQEEQKFRIHYINEFDEDIKCDTFGEFAHGGSGMKDKLLVGKKKKKSSFCYFISNQIHFTFRSS